MSNYQINPDSIPADLAADENITLWRYMPLSSLCEILIYKHLPLISISSFTDKTEGNILERVLSKLPNAHSESVELTMQIYRKLTYISSWHQSEIENAAMWDRYTYGGDGVAIKTNAKLLMDCIISTNPNRVGGPKFAGTMGDSSPSQININSGYVIKPVKYVVERPSEFEIQEDLLDEGYDKMCFFFKMMDFKDESEVRILSSHAINISEVVKRNPSEIAGIVKHAYKANNAVRLPIGSPDKLIRQVVVSPYAHNQFIETVRQVIARINYSRRIRTSQQVAVDYDIVESRRKEWI